MSGRDGGMFTSNTKDTFLHTLVHFRQWPQAEHNMVRMDSLLLLLLLLSELFDMGFQLQPTWLPGTMTRAAVSDGEPSNDSRCLRLNRWVSLDISE